MHEEHGFFDIEGLQLEYQLLTPAQSKDRTLIFLHEGLGCVAMWKDFPRLVARATDCPVLIYSRAGYGNSTPCPLPRPLSFMHDEALVVLPQILNAARVQKAVLVGHSDGASIALINAGGCSDERIQGLILMAPHVFVEELTLASIREAKIAFENTDLRQRLTRYHGDNVGCAFWGWNQAWLDKDFLDWNLEEYLVKIEISVLLIQGELDNYGTIKQLKKIQDHLLGEVELTLLPDCGHSPFRDQPTKTLQTFTDFLQKLT